MFKANKLLKVISILLIVFGALSLISCIMLLAIPSIGEAAAAAGSAVSMGDTIFSLVVTLIQIAIGVIGLAAKEEKIVLVAAIVYIALQVISLVISIMTTGFNALGLIGFILPALYFWGYYQSK